MASEIASITNFLWNLESIHASAAWSIEEGHEKVVIAVVDADFDLSHPALRRSNLAPPGADIRFGSPQSQPGAEHGTHVAAIAVGSKQTNGFSGVAPNCAWLPVRADLSEDSLKDRVAALAWLAELSGSSTARYVVNLSWEVMTPDKELHAVIQRLVNNGAIVVGAAGNSAVDTAQWSRAPGAYREVISVAATDHRDRKTDFSAYGLDVDVCAPGFEVYSAWGSGYRGVSGTSQACAQVAGLVGLIWSNNLKLEPLAVRELLLGTCDPIDDVNPDFRGKLGAGRINAARALAATSALS